MTDHSIIHQQKTASRGLSGQRGIMLIILAIFLGLAATAFIIKALNSSHQHSSRYLKSAEALAQAKAALIGYALSYDDVTSHEGEVFGYLPCPDTTATDQNGEGSQPSCGKKKISMLGKLPWKTLRTSPLKDGYGECLWYAVSGSYKNNPKLKHLSPETLGQLQVITDRGLYLADATDPAVAIIFAPGPVLRGQNRVGDASTAHCGGNYSAANYLDNNAWTGINNAVISSTPGAISTFSTAIDSQFGVVGSEFNDHLLLIKRSEIFTHYCKKYSNALLANNLGNTNKCNSSEQSISYCKIAATNLQNHCAPQVCKIAAQEIVTPFCLENLSTPACQKALTNLKQCHV